MKIKSYNLLFRIFSYLSDKTNGAPFFVKYKLMLGTLIIGLVSSSNGKLSAQKKTNTSEPVVAIPIRQCAPGEIEVKGKVQDEDGEALPGLSITIKNTNRAVISDIDGNFNIEAGVRDVLVFSYVGFEPKEIPALEVVGNPIVILTASNFIMCYDIVIVKTYRDDTYSKRTAPRKLKIDKISYSEAQTPPVSPAGGTDEFRKWIENNIIYNEQMLKDSIEGLLILNFTIDKKGKITDKKVLTKLSPDADKEVLRVLSTSDKWNPGIHNGKVIKAVVTIPVNFQLPSSK